MTKRIMYATLLGDLLAEFGEWVAFTTYRDSPGDIRMIIDYGGDFRDYMDHWQDIKYRHDVASKGMVAEYRNEIETIWVKDAEQRLTNLMGEQGWIFNDLHFIFDFDVKIDIRQGRGLIVSVWHIREKS